MPANDAYQFAYLDAPADVARFLDTLAGVREVAVDTEGASFHRYLDRIYLLQVTASPGSAVIDPVPPGVADALAPLGRLLEDRAVEVVFHDADYDLRLLHQDYGWRTTNIFDTRIAAQLLGLRAFGLGALTERYFGVVLDKKHQRADWSMRPLTADMLDYAAQDTRRLLELRDRLRAELAEKGRLGWAAEEFARLEGTRWEAEDPGLAYMKLKGARDLNRRELAVLREVAPWREETARAMDRSTFRVMGNEVLLEIARQQPQSRQALGQIKGVPRGLLEQRGEEVVEAVRRGLAVPDAELPRFARAARWERDPEFDDRVLRLKAVRDTVAQRLELDPGVLCSRERLETVARQMPTSIDEVVATTPGLRRWQAELLGDDLLVALRASGAPARAAAAPAADAPLDLFDAAAAPAAPSTAPAAPVMAPSPDRASPAVAPVAVAASDDEQVAIALDGPATAIAPDATPGTVPAPGASRGGLRSRGGPRRGGPARPMAPAAPAESAEEAGEAGEAGGTTPAAAPVVTPSHTPRPSGGGRPRPGRRNEDDRSPYSDA